MQEQLPSRTIFSGFSLAAMIFLHSIPGNPDLPLTVRSLNTSARRFSLSTTASTTPQLGGGMMTGRADGAMSTDISHLFKIPLVAMTSTRMKKATQRKHDDGLLLLVPYVLTSLILLIYCKTVKFHYPNEEINNLIP